MEACRLIIKKHLENALPLLRRYVENSNQEADLEDFEVFDDSFEDYNIDDDDFVSSAAAIQELITQDEHYHMARRIFQVVILGNSNGSVRVQDLKLIETVTDLYVSLRKELDSSDIDSELLENYLIQLEHYQKKL